MTLDDTITGLTDELALEAGQLLAVELGADPHEPPPVDLSGEPLIERPTEHLAELAELARLLLRATAADPDRRAAVERSIEGAGRRQLVLGGAELVALAALLVTAFHIKVTGGKASASSRTRIERAADGSEVVTIEESTSFGISGALAGFLGRLFPGGR